MPSRRAVGVVLLAAAFLLSSCGPPSSVTWRNITFDVPEGWHVVEQGPTRMTLASAQIVPTGGTIEPEAAPDEPVVAMWFSYEPYTLPDDWRDFVDEQGATLETDDQIRLTGDVPAARLIYSRTMDGVPTREMVLVIPARSVVVFAQPVPRPGDTDAPDVFLDHVATFLEVVESAEFGAPVED